MMSSNNHTRVSGPTEYLKKEIEKKNLEIFLYLTLRIVSQFFREFLQNEAEIQPRNSNI